MSNSDDHQQALQSERGAEVHFKEFLASYAEKKIWLQSSVKHSGNDVRSGRGGGERNSIVNRLNNASK